MVWNRTKKKWVKPKKVDKLSMKLGEFLIYGEPETPTTIKTRKVTKISFRVFGIPTHVTVNTVRNGGVK